MSKGDKNFNISHRGNVTDKVRWWMGGDVMEIKSWSDYKASKTETLDLRQRKSFLAMRQGGILF